jgi:hypothetical protein
VPLVSTDKMLLKNHYCCADNEGMVDPLRPTEQDVLAVNKRKRPKRIARAYEWFLNLPVPIVLVALWLAGVALISLGILALYLFWLALKVVAGG